MSAATESGFVMVDPDPDEHLEVRVRPFEPDRSGYAGEQLLSIYYRGAEESSVVLDSAQCERLAALLLGGAE